MAALASVATVLSAVAATTTAVQALTAKPRSGGYGPDPAETARAETEQIKATQDIEARRRQEELRRVLAAQRARLAANGVGTSGSGANLLRAIADDAARGQSDDDRMFQYRLDRIQQQARYGRNLLEPRQRPLDRFADAVTGVGRIASAGADLYQSVKRF